MILNLINYIMHINHTLLTGVSTLDRRSVTPGTWILPGVLHDGAKAFLTLLLGKAFSFPDGEALRLWVMYPLSCKLYEQQTEIWAQKK